MRRWLFWRSEERDDLGRGRGFMEKQNVLAYSETTKDVRITVYPQYLEEESESTKNVYAFAYTITIENHSAERVQLLRRHWIISSGGAQYNEVHGDGVVGEQPLLQPGHAFQYTSGAVIKDPVGSMHGSYTFRIDDGELIDVAIPHFDLLVTTLIH